MKTRVLILIACISVIAAAAWAHGGEEHVIGSVAKVTQDSITVKTTANKMVTVAVAPETKFIKDKAAAKIADLNVGDRVVIHAKEPTEGKLVADTVEFATAKPAPTASSQSSTGQSKTEQLTGVVSDSSCGATHAMKNMAPADCARMCVKAGRKYALVVGTDVYTLQGHEADLQKLAGDTVTVEGSVSGKAVTVGSVALAKKG
jgi:hypothetical protein